MKKRFLTHILIIILCFSCNSDNKPDTGKIPSNVNNTEEFIHLKIIPALTQKKELKLSELVDHIEYVQLESRRECMVAGGWVVVGEKYIVICTGVRFGEVVLLFNRQGKFIRKIGQKGQGPGEYEMPTQIDLSPNED